MPPDIPGRPSGQPNPPDDAERPAIILIADGKELPRVIDEAVEYVQADPDLTAVDVQRDDEAGTRFATLVEQYKKGEIAAVVLRRPEDLPHFIRFVEGPPTRPAPRQRQR